jgi:hypothetical protein
MRRFTAKHKQLTDLQRQCKRGVRGVFYVFPLVGTTLELSANSDLLSQTYLLDVSLIPPLAAPTTKAGTPRKSGIHYAYVAPTKVIFCSEPVKIPLQPASQLVPRWFGDAGLVSEGLDFETFEDLWAFRQYLEPRAAAMVLP